MSPFDAILLVVSVGIVLAMLLLLRRHQRQHCNHLHELSNAVSALVEFVDARVAGELPEDVREFVRDWRDQGVTEGLERL